MERVRSKQSPLRCPFCHEDVEVETQEWVACQACLGRHHASCWSEAGACASCQETAVLKSEEVEIPAPPPGETVGTAVHPRVDGSPEELHRLIETHEHGTGSSVLDYALAYPTLGLYPLFRGEHRLFKNAERNQEELRAAGVDAADPRLERHLRDATEGTRKGVVVRACLLGTMFLIDLMPIVLGFINLTSRDYLIRRVGDNQLAAGMVAWSLTLLLSLWLHWRAVKKHDSKQLYLGILSQGLSEADAKDALQEHKHSWLANGRSVFLGLLGTIIWPLAPIWVARGFLKPNDLHEEREATINAMTPKRRTETKAP